MADTGITNLHYPEPVDGKGTMLTYDIPANDDADLKNIVSVQQDYDKDGKAIGTRIKHKDPEGWSVLADNDDATKDLRDKITEKTNIAVRQRNLEIQSYTNKADAKAGEPIWTSDGLQQDDKGNYTAKSVSVTTADATYQRTYDKDGKPVYQKKDGEGAFAAIDEKDVPKEIGDSFAAANTSIDTKAKADYDKKPDAAPPAVTPDELKAKKYSGKLSKETNAPTWDAAGVHKTGDDYAADKLDVTVGGSVYRQTFDADGKPVYQTKAAGAKDEDFKTVKADDLAPNVKKDFETANDGVKTQAKADIDKTPAPDTHGGDAAHADKKLGADHRSGGHQRRSHGHGHRTHLHHHHHHAKTHDEHRPHHHKEGEKNRGELKGFALTKDGTSPQEVAAGEKFWSNHRVQQQGRGGSVIVPN